MQYSINTIIPNKSRKKLTFNSLLRSAKNTNARYTNNFRVEHSRPQLFGISKYSVSTSNKRLNSYGAISSSIASKTHNLEGAILPNMHQLKQPQPTITTKRLKIKHNWLLFTRQKLNYSRQTNHTTTTKYMPILSKRMYMSSKRLKKKLTNNINSSRARLKTMKSSRLFSRDINTKYSMLFKKNSLLTHTIDPSAGVHIGLSLTLLLTDQKTIQAKTQPLNQLSRTDFIILSQPSNTLLNTLTPHQNLSLNLTLYTNSIFELFFNKNHAKFNLPIRDKIVNALTHNVSILKLPLVGGTVERRRVNTSIATYWALESLFVRPKSLASKTAVFILAKAPTYRMDIKSQAPISTSQHNGNLHSRYGLLSGNTNGAISSLTNVLLTKSTTSSAVMCLLRPHKNKIQQTPIKHLLARVKASTIKTITSSYKDLLYTPAALTLSILTSKPSRPAFEENHTRIQMRTSTNLKHAIVTSRFPKKGLRGRPLSITKLRFIEDPRPVLYNKKSRLRKFTRNVYRRLSRFIKWKTKKSTYFFIKFRKLNRKRKTSLKNIVPLSYLFNKPGKYQSLYATHPRSINRVEQNLINNYSTKRTGYDYQTLSTTLKTQPMPSETKTLNTFHFAQLNMRDLTHEHTLWLLLLNPLTLKSILFNSNTSLSHKTFGLQLKKTTGHAEAMFMTNLVPHNSFRKSFSKKVLNSFANRLFREDIIPYYQNTLIRFIEYCTGRKVLFQFYPFVNQHIDKSYIVRYKRWLPRMSFYERRLGHKFFLEEALHIMHISFILRDPKIIATWLKAIILRISFWKTRSIFRFLKYLFHNYFTYVFDDIKIKGLKIRLKGKISSAGNSRKRTILYRVGRTSHSEVNLRVAKDFSLINTFTGVMGFQVYLFY